MELSPAKRALMEKWLKGRQPDQRVFTIPVRPADRPLVLSLPQQRQLFLELLDRGTAVNTLSILLELKGSLDLPALTQSANQILARHHLLRTRFVMGTGFPSPEIVPQRSISLPLVDLAQTGEPELAARRLAEKEVLLPFDISQAPLIRLRLYRVQGDKHILLVAAHHTVADGWSLGVFLTELMSFYAANIAGQQAALPDLPIQYADYAHWQSGPARQDAHQSSLAYWKQQLAGELPILELHTDRPRGARQSFNGGTHRFVLSREMTSALENFGRQEDVTLFMTLLTGFSILLHRYSGQDEVVIGTPVANRNLPELEPLMGVFINTLALRTRLHDDPGFRHLLQRIRQVSLDAYAHQDLPFEKLVEELNPPRDLSRSPLFQVVFNLQSSPLPRLEIPGLKANFLDIDRGVSQFDLTLMVSRVEGECLATVEYNSDLFEAATISRLFESFQLLLQDALARPDLPVSTLNIAPAEEMQFLVQTLNQTSHDFPREVCMHQLFEAQAALTPHLVALIHGDTRLTYRELNEKANALARHLLQMGVGPQVRVGIWMKKSWEMIPALLAVHKTGASYVPLHPSYPAERVEYMLLDAAVQLLITNIPSPLSLTSTVQLLKVDAESFPIHPDVTNLTAQVTPQQEAYVIYTSGSTGKPKGVVVNHASLVNFLTSMQENPGITQGDVLLAVTAISFDIAALELFLPLMAGASVVIAGEEITSNPMHMGDLILRHKVNIMQATPASWQILLDTGWKGTPGLKALCGGETLTRKLADQLLDRVESLWNMYGPTETTIWSSVSRIHKDGRPISIGQPIHNTQLYILGPGLLPLPKGIVGELYIGGEGLAVGYLNQPGLTQQRFIPDPFSATPDARMYRTGDRAIYLSDGSIQVLGRIDDQFKLNGNRLELGEITQVLLQHPAVSEAIVWAHTGTYGDKRLLACYVSREEPAPDGPALRDFLQQFLPAYMIPSSFTRLDSLPLTPNGKVDRKALPVPGDLRPLSGYAPPRNEKEQVLVDIWQNILNVGQVGIHDNFFELGGASIQSLQVVARANMYGIRINVENLFEHQTVAELAAYAASPSQ